MKKTLNKIISIIINILINAYDKISGNKEIRKSINERWGGLNAGSLC